MKNGALAFSLLFSAGVIAVAGFVGCSGGDDTPAAETDSGTDSGVVDTGKPDTGADTTPASTCPAPLPSDFACEKPTVPAGSNKCNDAAIKALADGCFGATATSTTCSAAQKKYPDCNKCMLQDWIVENPDTGGGSINEAGCFQAVDPSGTCGTTIGCTTACLQTVCSLCDTTEGSGRTMSTSQADNCYSDSQYKGSSTRPKGLCYDVAAKDYATCAGDTKFQFCQVRTADDIVNFYRGACRDNANWTNADKEDGTLSMGDAGPDGGSETGTEAGTDAATESGTETGTDAATESGADAESDAADGGTDAADGAAD